MGTAVVRQRTTTIARPLQTLVPLIQRALIAGDEAGLEHYRQAGVMLLEAREQVAPHRWSVWLTKHFTLSKATASRYMRFAERVEEKPSLMKKSTLRDALGEKRSEANRRVGEWAPINTFTEKVDTERLSQERQNRAKEVELHQKIAVELVDIGYKALATRLHPDRGGSFDAMRRLNRVRDELKGLAKSRRFN